MVGDDHLFGPIASGFQNRSHFFDGCDCSGHGARNACCRRHQFPTSPGDSEHGVGVESTRCTQGGDFTVAVAANTFGLQAKRVQQREVTERVGTDGRLSPFGGGQQCLLREPIYGCEATPYAKELQEWF